MDLVQLAGWIAAAFTVAAYSMRTMLPLRLAGIGANVFFLVFGWFAASPQVFVLHAILLPCNLWRLFEIVRMRRRARSARSTDHPLDWIRPLVKPVTLAPGSHVFRKGDPPDHLYYLVNGTVHLEEIDVRLGAGELFGEIAFFTEAKERTLSARAEGPCEILALDERDFLKLYYQNPAFGLYIVRLVARRLLDGAAINANAYVRLAGEAGPESPVATGSA